ncbi:MAG TPA: DUF4388 domain-containing protein [Ktedonobacterales bacterium]|nr:DUF4388 domain-containing protein [Ktedonobacterales bacterium]
MESQGRILDGNLETLGLQATLKMLALSGKTGVLSVTSGQERLAIFLEEGLIIDLDEPGTPAPDLIDMFRLLHRINKAKAVELRSLAGTNPTVAMDIMVHMNIMQRAERHQRIEFRVIQCISHAIRWERGRFEFHRDVAAISGRVAPEQRLNVDHVLLEALRLADEWGRAGSLALGRATIARWMPEPEFQGDIAGLGLTQDEIHVLCLSNGQFPLHAISYALLIPESTVATIMRKLIDLGLIEVVDARLETELERNLANLLTQSQHQLSQDPKPNPEQRMLLLVKTMGTCVNGLLAHHALFARTLRGRGEVPKADVVHYIEATFGPLLTQLQRNFPRMDEIIRFVNGRIDYADLESLDRVVRGQELADCYWDAVQLLSHFMRSVFDRVLTDEVGKSRVGRQFEDLWSAFLHEIDEEIARHQHRRAAAHAQADRFAQVRVTPEPRRGMAYAEYEMAPDTRRRFS